MNASISYFRPACLLSVAALPCGQSSTVGWIPKDDSPILMIRRDSDTTVLLEQSVGMETAYRKAGLDVDLITVKHAGYGLRPAVEPPVSLQLSDVLQRLANSFKNNSRGRTC